MERSSRIVESRVPSRSLAASLPRRCESLFRYVMYGGDSLFQSMVSILCMLLAQKQELLSALDS